MREKNRKRKLQKKLLWPVCACSMVFVNALPAPVFAQDDESTLVPLLHTDFEQGTLDTISGSEGELTGNAACSASAAGLGTALDLSDGGYLTLPEGIELGTEDFTVSFMVKNLEDTNDTVLFGNKTGDSGKDDGFGIFSYDGVFGNAGYEGVRYDTSSYDRDKTVLDGEWHYVTVSADRDRALSLYVDGELSSENTSFASIKEASMDTGDAFVLGAGSRGAYEHRALYDELDIYQGAMSAAQAKEAWQTMQKRMTLDKDLDLYVPFEDGAFKDLTGNHTITEKGTTAFEEGLKGQAYSTSEGGYLQLDESFSLGKSDFTVSFWYKAHESVNGAALFGNKDGTSGYHKGFFMCNWNGLYANYGNGSKRYDTSSYDRDQVIMDGDWHLVTVTADRDGALSLYRDGVLSGANTDSAALKDFDLDNTSLYTIGAGTKGTQRQSGAYDEFKVYKKALSAEEVSALYNADHDVLADLNQKLAALKETDIEVPMGASEDMILQAVQSEVNSQLGNAGGAEIAITKKDGGFEVALSMAGVTAVRLVNFNVHEKDTLTVATFNVYGWGYPNMAKFSHMLNDEGVDLAGLQECNHNVNGGGQDEQFVKGGDYPYYAFKAGYGSPTQWGGSTLVSKYPLENKGGENYKTNDSTNRSFVRSEIMVGDKKVALYCTHIVWLKDQEEYKKAKQAEYDELIEAVEADTTTYKIIMGDFNSDDSIQELDNLLLHFNDANGWNNNWLETHPVSINTGCIDQIFTTTNIEIVDARVIEGNPSDHDPLIAELRLLDTEPTLPTQLVDNALANARKALEEAENLPADEVASLQALITEVENTELTKDNRLTLVKRLRQAVENLGNPLYGSIIDDTSPYIVYSEGDANYGGWKAGGSGEPRNTEHYSNTVGATLTLPFSGQNLEIYGPKAPNHRMFSVSIDGGEPVKADAYSPSRTSPDTLLFSAADAGVVLDEGEHTAVLTILDEANPAASNLLGMSVTYFKTYTSTEEPEPEPFDGYTVVEDMQITTADELFKVKYNGSWAGGTYYPNMFHDGYEHYAHSGDSFEMKFIGNKVEMWGTKDPGHGEYTYSIDGEVVGTGSATNSSRVHQQMIFETPELEYGEHTLKVELVGQSGKAIQLDYLKVYHDELTPAGLSIDGSQDTLLPGATLQLNASVNPWNASADVEWTSSDPQTAYVSKTGLVRVPESVKTKKTVTITAAVVNHPEISASRTFTVDPTLSVMNAYVGSEKLLEMPEDYETLSTQSGESFKGTLWLDDEINSKVNVAAMTKDLHNVEVTFSDFTSEDGTTLASDAFSYGWLETTTANIGRGNGSAPVKTFPDKIGNPGKIDIPAGTLRFAWLSIQTTKDTKPGTYTGQVIIKADELDEQKTLNYTIEVLNLLQPDEELTEVQLWQHPFSQADYYLGLGKTPSGGICNEKNEDFYFTKEHFDLMRDSMVEYAKTGGHDAVANIVDQAWGHQSYYYDLSMVKWIQKADGSWTFDYTWYDAWINFMIECGVLDPANGIGQIKAYSIVPWNNQIAWEDEATGTTKKQTFNPGSDGWKEMWTRFLQDYMQHSIEKGWLDITYISMDERSLSQLQPAVELIRSIESEDGKQFKISSALNYGAPEYYDFTDKIDDISINLGNTSKTATKALSEHRDALGLKTTFYTCTGDYPSNFMISDPGDNYWDMLYTNTLGTSGYMRWAYDNFVYDMHGNATYRYWEPGDGWFIYPLERGSDELIQGKNFYSTPRYEMFRQGVRDSSKIRWLLVSDRLSDEEKQALQDAVNAMSKPSQSTSYGSAVPSSQAVRLSVHAQTDAVASAMQDTARTQASLPEEPVEAANKTLLNQAIQYAEEQISAGALENLNTVVKAYFESALEEARTISLQEDASQEEVNTAWLKLCHALQMLDFKSDKELLNALIAQAQTLDLDQYKDDEAKEAFVLALNRAREVAASDTALNDSINEAAGALQSAMDALNLKDDAYDLSLLAWLVSQAEEMNGEDYLEAGWSQLETVLEQAAAILDNPESQEEIDQACMDLNAAILNLRLKPSEDLLRELNAFVDTVNALNLEPYSMEQRTALFTLSARVQAALDSETLDQDQAAALAAETRKAQEIIDHPAALNPSAPDKTEENSNPKTEPVTPDQEQAKKPVSDQNEQQTKTGAKSVRTAVSTSFGSAAAAFAAAALACLSVLRRRR